MQKSDFPRLHPTRYCDSTGAIYYWKQSPGLWRFVHGCGHEDNFAVVGNQYRTKDEILADLPRYAESWGYRG